MGVSARLASDLLDALYINSHGQKFGTKNEQPVALEEFSYNNPTSAFYFPRPTAPPPAGRQDAVRNGKSPTSRIALIWRKLSCRRGAAFGERIPGSESRARPKDVAMSMCGAAGGGMESGRVGHGVWGREGLGRFVQGCMIFVGELLLLATAVSYEALVS